VGQVGGAAACWLGDSAFRQVNSHLRLVRAHQRGLNIPTVSAYGLQRKSTYRSSATRVEEPRFGIVLPVRSQVQARMPRLRKAPDSIEWRKLYLIARCIPTCSHLLDLGSGYGQYVPQLQRKSKRVVAADLDKNRCEIMRDKGFAAIVADAQRLPFADASFDCVWASEIVEHIPCLAIFDELERVSRRLIIATMPNPLSPHYRRDSTHVLKYSVPSLRQFLGARGETTGWRYRVVGLGIDEIAAPVFVKRFTTYLLWYLPWISPTIAVIGHRRTGKR